MTVEQMSVFSSLIKPCHRSKKEKSQILYFWLATSGKHEEDSCGDFPSPPQNPCRLGLSLCLSLIIIDNDYDNDNPASLVAAVSFPAII